MESINRGIGARLSAARRVVFSSAREFANKYQMAESTYSQHETGKRALSVSVLLNYACWLEVSPGWLLTGEGAPYPDHDDTTRESKLYQNLSVLDQVQIAKMHNNYLIKGNVARVEVHLFSYAFKYFFRLCKEHTLLLDAEKSLSLLIDTYNSIVQTGASIEDKYRMVELSMDSIFRGLQVSDVKLKERERRK
jgi:transcriptional regulator with XRE-family HTH domain